MRYTIIKLFSHINNILYQYIHLNPAKTLALLVYACVESRSALVSSWAGVLAQIKGQALDNCKFVIWRFLRESVFAIWQVYAGVIHFLFSRMPLHKHILVCMDWTDVSIFKVLALGVVIESIGISIPIYIKVIRKDKTAHEMTYLEQEMLHLFFSILELDIRRRIIILADRGFAKVELFKTIKSYKARFIIRLPRTAHMKINGEWINLGVFVEQASIPQIHLKVLYTKEHNFTLNIIINKPLKTTKEEDDEDVWILATNGYFEIEQACQMYSRRMRIEQTFRVMKKKGFNCEQALCQDEYACEKIMLVIVLSYVVVITFYWTWADEEVIKQVTIKHKKKGINEHSEFVCALRFLQGLLRIEGITQEGMQFIYEYLLICTKKRRVVKNTVRVNFSSSA